MSIKNLIQSVNFCNTQNNASLQNTKLSVHVLTFILCEKNSICLIHSSCAAPVSTRPQGLLECLYGRVASASHTEVVFFEFTKFQNMNTKHRFCDHSLKIINYELLPSQVQSHCLFLSFSIVCSVIGSRGHQLFGKPMCGILYMHFFHIFL